MPDVGEVPGPTSRHDKQRIDAYIITVAHVARREPLGGDDDPSQPPLVKSEAGGFLSRARLDFDECQRAPAPCNDIDLSARNARSAGQDSPAVQPQEPAGEGLRAAPALFRLPTGHRQRSSARA